MKASDIDGLLERAVALDNLLKRSPELLAFARSLQEAREPVLLMAGDRFVLTKEAAETLGVNETTIGSYVKRGLLKAYRLPGSSYRRFKLSDLWGLAKVEA